MAQAQPTTHSKPGGIPMGADQYMRQMVILDTNQVLDYIKPISKNLFWAVVKKDPRFPKPVIGGNGGKALYGREAIDNYLAEVARTGLQNPDGSRYSGADD